MKKEDAEGRLASASSVTLEPFKGVWGRGRDPDTKGALVPHGSCADQPLSRPPPQAVYAPVPAPEAAFRPVLGSAGTRLNATRYFMSRRRLALGGMNARFCLLSYFIYIF